MAVLSNEEIKKAIASFLSKYSDKLECKTYGYNEIVRREGNQDQTIFIIKEGVFSVGRTFTLYTPKSHPTFAFCFKSDIIVPVASIVPDFPSLFQIKSVENNLSKTNMLYEISFEQWNSLVADDETLKRIPKSATYDNLSTFIELFALFRQNRNVKKLFAQMYKMKHPILYSGIPDHELANFFGVTLKSFKRMMDKKY